jgi:hypothetical protein
MGTAMRPTLVHDKAPSGSMFSSAGRSSVGTGSVGPYFAVSSGTYSNPSLEDAGQVDLGMEEKRLEFLGLHPELAVLRS